MRWNQESLQTIYPHLPDILPEEVLDILTTFERQEKELVFSRTTPRKQYLLGVYLKAAAFFGHIRFRPTQLSLLFRLRVAKALGLSKDLVHSADHDQSEKSRLIAVVRQSLPLTRFSASIQQEFENLLRNGIAKRESEFVPIINNAIQEIRTRNVELPPFEDLESLARTALTNADRDLEQLFHDNCGQKEVIRLDSMLYEDVGRTFFDQSKDPIGAASSVTLLKELERLEKIILYAVPEAAISNVCQRKREVFAAIASRLNVQELKQITAKRRHLLLACHVWGRQRHHLDELVEIYCKVWDHTLAQANQYAQDRQIKYADAQERHHGVLKDLVGVIRTNRTESDLWRGIHSYKKPEDYDKLQEELGEVPTWSTSYHKKLRDFYSSQRRFLPKWYELMPLSTTTTDPTLVAAAEFLKKNASGNETELPIQAAPLGFLTDEWQSRTLKHHLWTKELLSVHKVPYEQAYLASCVSAFRNGTLKVTGSQKYAPITDLLLPKDTFLANYKMYTKQLGWPESPENFIEENLVELKTRLREFDNDYQSIKRSFWITKKGKLGFSRTRKQHDEPVRIKRLTEQLQAYFPKVTILELLLDVHNLTGFLDHYRALVGRQNMSELDRILHLIATHYAYGCNTGPSQAAQATGLLKSQIVYMRRRYTGIKQLTRAASTLADAYSRTTIAALIGDPNVFMTDSMRFRTLKKSLVAREHHRYKDGKSILLFQHVMSNCICLFTKALICNVSEAIQMLIGALAIQQNGEKLINICDSAGKSVLGLGLGKLMNVIIWPRFRSRNLRLWGVSRDEEYLNISHGIAGNTRQDLIYDGWKDMMWILASIYNGTSHPGLILEQLARMPNHPATLGFKELGKIERTSFLLRYGMNMETRHFIQKYTSRREHWNKFARSVFHAFGGMVREKNLEDQEEVFWFLTVVQNAIILWNAHALEQAIASARKDGISFTDEDLAHVLPTLLEHINFVGKFDLDMDRKLPFLKTAFG